MTYWVRRLNWKEDLDRDHDGQLSISELAMAGSPSAAKGYRRGFGSPQDTGAGRRNIITEQRCPPGSFQHDWQYGGVWWLMVLLSPSAGWVHLVRIVAERYGLADSHLRRLIDVRTEQDNLPQICRTCGRYCPGAAVLRVRRLWGGGTFLPILSSVLSKRVRTIRCFCLPCRRCVTCSLLIAGIQSFREVATYALCMATLYYWLVRTSKRTAVAIAINLALMLGATALLLIILFIVGRLLGLWCCYPNIENRFEALLEVLRYIGCRGKYCCCLRRPPRSLRVEQEDEELDSGHGVEAVMDSDGHVLYHRHRRGQWAKLVPVDGSGAIFVDAQTQRPESKWRAQYDMGTPLRQLVRNIDEQGVVDEDAEIMSGSRADAAWSRWLEVPDCTVTREEAAKLRNLPPSPAAMASAEEAQKKDWLTRTQMSPSSTDDVPPPRRRALAGASPRRAASALRVDQLRMSTWERLREALRREDLEDDGRLSGDNDSGSPHSESACARRDRRALLQLAAQARKAEGNRLWPDDKLNSEGWLPVEESCGCQRHGCKRCKSAQLVRNHSEINLASNLIRPH
jgi:hypothetical protein